jgi:6-phosphogluconolactonase
MYSTTPLIHISPDSNHLSTTVAEFVIKLSHESVERSGKFHVAVSGGSLPGILGNKLKLPSYSSKVSWANWVIWFVDERYLPLDNSESNYKVTKETLLNFVPIPAENIHHLDYSLPLPEAAKQYQSQLHKEFGNNLPELDLILLGMGPDGHTASLFPFHRLLNESSQWIASIEDSPKPPPQRITFTFPIINNAKNIAFVAAGEAKKEMLWKILEAEDIKEGELPSRLVKAKSGGVHWFIDAPAALLLKNYSKV